MYLLLLLLLQVLLPPPVVIVYAPVAEGWIGIAVIWFVRMRKNV